MTAHARAYRERLLSDTHALNLQPQQPQLKYDSRESPTAATGDGTGSRLGLGRSWARPLSPSPYRRLVVYAVNLILGALKDLRRMATRTLQ